MIEILFFDDNIKEIEPVARTLQLRTKLVTASTDSIEDALRLVRAEQIKVAVLDQRMEEQLDITGTMLFDKIQSIDKRVRGIIFSGQSEKTDVVEANTRGLRYLDKGCKPEELARAVIAERDKYLAEAELDYDRTAQQIGRYRGSRFARPGQLIELLTIEDLSTRAEVHDDDYQTFFEIGSGETRRSTRTVSVAEEVLIEQESLDELEAGLRLGPAAARALSLRVRESLTRRNQLRSGKSVGESLEETARLSRADEVAQVIHRRLEIAPAFVRRRAVLRVTCECCGERRVFALNIRQWSGRHHVRQLDTFRDGRTETYDLGQR
jgi:ActR/RegA family two-component response regulator